MSKASLVLFCFLVCSLGSSLWGTLAQDPPRKVGLEDAKKFAIEHNLEVLSLRQGLDESRAKFERSKSAFYPKLGLVGGVDTELASQANRTAGVGYLHTTLNVFSGMEDSYKKTIAEIGVEKAQVKLKRTEFRVGLDVEKLFHGYLYKKQALALKGEQLELNESHMKMAKQRRSSGITAESDVMEFELKESLIRSDTLLLEQEIEENRSNIKRLLGEEVGSKIEPVGYLQHQHLKGSLMDNLQKIQKESEVVVTASKDLEIATIESKLWRSKWLPKLELDGRAGYLPLDERPPQGGASVRGMVLAKFDLFSGFDTAWEKSQQESNRLKSEALLKDAILSAVTQTEIAFRKIHTIQARVDLEEENELRARKYYKSVLSEYRRGLKNSADLKVAAEGVFDACLKRETFKYDFLVQRIELERALGGPVATELVADEHELKEHTNKKKKEP